MNTNLKLSNTREVRIIAGVELAAEKTYSSEENIHQTLSLGITSSKSKESLQLQIEGLWQTFCAQAEKLTYVLSSSETTGQPAATQNVTVSGQKDMGANLLSVRNCQYHGPETFNNDPLSQRWAYTDTMGVRWICSV